MNEVLMAVRDLRVEYRSDRGSVAAVRGVSFALGRERLGIVGESGSGKSTVGRALMGLVPPPARVVAAEMRLGDLDLRSLSPRAWRRVRGRRIAMVLQDARASLNPVMPVGQQIAETHRAHRRADAGAARLAALAMLEAVRIRDPERVYRLFPHEVSGGMGQRVMIAMMLIAEPDILIADEPTSALDASVQASVLAILDDLVRARGMGLLLISHNLPLVQEFCDRVLVMYAGRVVETCAAAGLAQAHHPYTRGLMEALPSLAQRRAVLPQLRRDPAWLDG